MRTLLISDLHIGAGFGRSTLDDPQVVEKLAAAIARADRLILLGDVVEMRELPLRDALAAASRVLPKLVAGLGTGSEIVVLQGNHDHQLLAPYFRRRAASAPPSPLALDEVVDWVPGEPLAELARLLGTSGAAVSGRYPGIWLRDDVYAHHGHYLDAHTTTPSFERLAAGAMSRALKLPLNEIDDADEHERILTPIYAWMYAVTQGGDGEVDSAEAGASMRVLNWLRAVHGPAALALDFGLRAAFATVGAIGLGSLSGDLSQAHLTRGGLTGFTKTLEALKLTPHYAIFGHTHRAGPLPTDDAEEWRTPAGVRLINSGSWVNESLIGDDERDGSGYRPGFTVQIDASGAPRLVNVLDAD
jgi:predicted phosphodiesterase